MSTHIRAPIHYHLTIETQYEALVVLEAVRRRMFRLPDRPLCLAMEDVELQPDAGNVYVWEPDRRWRSSTLSDMMLWNDGRYWKPPYYTGTFWVYEEIVQQWIPQSSREPLKRFVFQTFLRQSQDDQGKTSWRKWVLIFYSSDTDRLRIPHGSSDPDLWNIILPRQLYYDHNGLALSRVPQPEHLWPRVFAEDVQSMPRAVYWQSERASSQY